MSVSTFRFIMVGIMLALLTVILLNSNTWASETETTPAAPTPTLSGKNTPSSAIVLAEGEIVTVRGDRMVLPQTVLTVDYSAGVYMIVDPDGDRFICEIRPETHKDMQRCQYAQ